MNYYFLNKLLSVSIRIASAVMKSRTCSARRDSMHIFIIAKQNAEKLHTNRIIEIENYYPTEYNFCPTMITDRECGEDNRVTFTSKTASNRNS